MAGSAQLDMFAGTPGGGRELPCSRWHPDRDGYLPLPGVVPLFVRHLDAGDARLNAGTRVGRQLTRGGLAQLGRLAVLGCLTWGHYERVDSGPWERFPRGTHRRYPALSSVAGFAAFRTSATAALR
jgi:hypothetical protein